MVMNEFPCTKARLPSHQELLDLLPDAVCVVDGSGQFLYVSAAFESLFGHSPHDVVGASMESLIHPDDLNRTRHAAEQVMAGQPLPNYRNRYRHRDGHYVDVQWSARWAGSHGVRVAVAHEVGRLRAREQELEFQALHDPLTGLPNRAHLLQELATRISRAASGGPAVGLLFLDLDGFKAANDRFGHEAGDRLLCRIAQRMRAGLRDRDFIARMGGDEFVVVLWDCDNAEKAATVSRALERMLLGTPDDPAPLNVGVSIGVAHHPADGNTAGELLTAADRRMYLTKGTR